MIFLNKLYVCHMIFNLKSIIFYSWVYVYHERLSS